MTTHYTIGPSRGSLLFTDVPDRCAVPDDECKNGDYTATIIHGTVKEYNYDQNHQIFTLKLNTTDGYNTVEELDDAKNFLKKHNSGEITVQNK